MEIKGVLIQRIEHSGLDMPKIFLVENEYQLGNAIWQSNAGDSIKIQSGEYGYIPIKNDVSIIFQNDASAAGLIGLGINLIGEWNASSVSSGNVSIEQPKIKPSNINCTYLYHVTLPINSRLSDGLSFIHANGSVVTLKGNNKDAFTLGSEGPAADALPRAIMEISVPVLDNFDVDLSKIPNILSDNKQDLENRIKNAVPQMEKRKAAEREEENRKIGLILNEFEYRALWAANDFLREYGRVIKSDLKEGFSTVTFLDGSKSAIQKSNGEICENHSRQYVAGFSNVPLKEDVSARIQFRILSSRSYSLQEMVQSHLEKLDYHAAILGMYQQFEAKWYVWEEGRNAQKNKWDFIQVITQDISIKAALAEMINARNWVAHSGVLKTEDSDRNKLKSGPQWRTSILTEYEIFAHKKPWVWNIALKQFLFNC